MPRSDCASAQSDLGLRCRLTESLDIEKCINGEQRPWCDCAHAQDHRNLRIAHVLEGTFSLEEAQLRFGVMRTIMMTTDKSKLLSSQFSNSTIPVRSFVR